MQEKAVVTATEAQVTEMFDVSSVGYFEEMYLHISDGRFRVLVGTPGGSSGGFIDAVEAFFEGIEGSTEAYVNVSDIRNYLRLVSDGPSTVLRFVFEGQPDDRLASRLTITREDDEDEFMVRLVLSSGESVIESVPTALPKMFDEENRIIHPVEERPAKYTVSTYVGVLKKIIDAVNLREDLEYCPLVIDDGEFRLDVGDEANQLVSARLQASVEGGEGGESIKQLYGGSFEDVVKTLDGKITLMFEEDSPLLLLKERNHMVVRHTVGSAV